ncbi:hypothetical protein RJT34_18142 [Clitoria ternatea]|uniref:Rhodanese domain-containing protein n=1 Tax=Clitoria ternatea TaxID=43366 RepID=A0AAN9JAS6_CLITE
MDSLCLLSSYPLSTKTLKPSPSIPSSPQLHLPSTNKTSFRTHSPNPLQNPLTKSFLSLATTHLFAPFSSLAIEDAAITPSVFDSDAGKINIESILVSIDNFLIEYPFFVAGCTFIWLVVIPLTQEYLSKCKFVPAIDAFRKLRDDPNSQLLDIRDRKNVKFLKSPNLKMLGKEVVQVEFTEEGNEDEFVKKALERFNDVPNTVVFVLDSFDGNSMKVAQLLFKNGFKEAYAIRGGVRGRQGWMGIQDTLLPPSVHMKKKKKASKQLNENGNGAILQNDSKNDSSLSPDIPTVGNQKTDNGHVKRSVELESTPEVKIGSVASSSSSPYPNYPDLKPPSSPTPSKPQ